MAEGKKSATIYCDLIHTVEELKDADAGKLFKHYLRYINDKNPDPPSQLIKIVFEPIKQQLKRDLKKWEGKSIKNKEAAEIRWRNKKNANAYERIKPDAKHADTVTVTDTVKDTDTVKVKVKDIKKEIVPFVFLTDGEYLKIEQVFPLQHHDAMTALSNYKQSSGKKYKSDYHALIGWVKDKFEKEKKLSGQKASKLSGAKEAGEASDARILEQLKQNL